MRQILSALNDSDTYAAVTAERAALAALGGGCQVPIGVFCRRAETGWHISGCVARPDGGVVLRAHDEGSDVRALGEAIAQKLLSLGARELLAGQGVSV